jgi:hypothetical protein
LQVVQALLEEGERGQGDDGDSGPPGQNTCVGGVSC